VIGVEQQASASTPPVTQTPAVVKKARSAEEQKARNEVASHLWQAKINRDTSFKHMVEQSNDDSLRWVMEKPVGRQKTRSGNNDLVYLHENQKGRSYAAVNMLFDEKAVGEKVPWGTVLFKAGRNQNPKELARQSVLEYRADKIKDQIMDLYDAKGIASRGGLSQKTYDRIVKLRDQIAEQRNVIESKMPKKFRPRSTLTNKRRYEVNDMWSTFS
jgi:hypothetical protein